MSLIQLLLIAVGLAMDAFAVAVCKGLKMKRIDLKYAVLIAAFFGVFQAVMPLAGWLLGKQFQGYITSFDHWIAFGLLLLIGGQMIWEAFQKEVDDKPLTYDFKELTMLAVATSIDALAVGVTFAFLDTDIASAVLTIGVVTFLLSLLGVRMGNRFGVKYKSRAELFGGVILVLIGGKILFEHLEILPF